jgi:MFS family permease
VGLVIGGLAQSMLVLVVGRCLQGFGAGAIPATAYVAVARGIPAPLRPRMFAVTSTAWVVPAAIGPAAALGIEHALSWRAVFLVLVPLVLVAGVLTAPALRQLGPPAPEEGEAAVEAPVPRRHASDAARLRLVVVLVVSVGAVFAAGSGPPLPVAVALVAVGAPVASYCVLHLLPAGTVRLAPGIPATVALRGLLTFAFFSADAFVTLTVTDGRGQAEWIGGVALALCTFSWTAASWVQERVIDRLGPRRLDQIGFVVLVASLVAMIAVAQGAPIALTVVAWGAAGFAIGLAYAPQAVTVLALAPAGQEGATSAAIQLSDGLGIALGTGLAGGVVALADRAGWSVARGVTGVFVMALVVAVVGLAAARRLPAEVPSSPSSPSSPS